MPRFGHRSRKGRGSPGSPTEASADRPRNRLRRNIDWFTSWLDNFAPGREVILVGFSGGAAFAGGLLLDQPSRYSGAAILYGTLPFDSGVPVTPGRLAGIPVFVAQGDQDTVIPRELLDATWGYLTNPSGAPAWATRYRGRPRHLDVLPIRSGRLAAMAARLSLRAWTGLRRQRPLAGSPWRRPARTERIASAGQHEDAAGAADPEQPTGPARGPLRATVGLPGVATRPSAISVPGARAFTLTNRSGPQDAFLVAQAGEFAHLHPKLRQLVARRPTSRHGRGRRQQRLGRGTPAGRSSGHAGMVTIFGPRTESELDEVSAVIGLSRSWAANG